MRRRVLLSVLLTVLLLNPISAQPSGSSGSSDDGQKSGSEFTQKEVEDLTADLMDEAERAIDQAYAEGFKAGLLESAPDAEYWKTLADSHADGFSAASFLAGTGAGAVITAIVVGIIYIGRR